MAWMRVLVKKVEYVNALLASSHRHIIITTKPKSNVLGRDLNQA